MNFKESLTLIIYHNSGDLECKTLVDELLRDLKSNPSLGEVRAVRIKELPSEVRRLIGNYLVVHVFTLLVTPGRHFEKNVLPSLNLLAKSLKVKHYGLPPTRLLLEAVMRASHFNHSLKKITLSFIHYLPSETGLVKSRMEEFKMEALKFKVELNILPYTRICEVKDTVYLVTVCPSKTASTLKRNCQVVEVPLLKYVKDLVVEWIVESVTSQLKMVSNQTREAL